MKNLFLLFLSITTFQANAKFEKNISMLECRLEKRAHGSGYKLAYSKDWDNEKALIENTTVTGKFALEELQQSANSGAKVEAIVDALGIQRGTNVISHVTKEKLLTEDTCETDYYVLVKRYCTVGEMQKNAVCKSYCELDTKFEDCR